MGMLKRLWNEEDGFVVSAELVLVATILVLGMIVGLASLRDQVVQELGDVAAAVSQMVQTYSYSGITGHTSRISGSKFADKTDFCDFPADTEWRAPVCISLCIEAEGEQNW
jgi:Flp pilus assembly pilin Flp